MVQKKNLNECPKCHGKTEFIPIGSKTVKGKIEGLFGRYKCIECDWRSDIQEPFHLAKTTRPRNPVYMYHTYNKEHKTLMLFVYTNELKVEGSHLVGEKFDRHLLTAEITPHSIRKWPKARLRIEENEESKKQLLLDQENEPIGNVNSSTEAYESGVKEIKELIDRIQNGHVNDIKAADSIARAGEFQKNGYRIECISNGKILMKKELEKILFSKKLQYDKEFRKKVLEDQCYSDADLYKNPL